MLDIGRGNHGALTGRAKMRTPRLCEGPEGTTLSGGRAPGGPVTSSEADATEQPAPPTAPPEPTAADCVDELDRRQHKLAAEVREHFALLRKRGTK